MSEHQVLSKSKIAVLVNNILCNIPSVQRDELIVQIILCLHDNIYASSRLDLRIEKIINDLQNGKLD